MLIPDTQDTAWYYFERHIMLRSNMLLQHCYVIPSIILTYRHSF